MNHSASGNGHCVQSHAPASARSGVLIDLGQPEATNVELVGGKAAALAAVLSAGIHALPGTVLTTEFCEAIDGGGTIEGHPAIDEAWSQLHSLAPDASRFLARSSSVVEDAEESSAAGQFESVGGIEDRDALVDAVRVVLDSRAAAGAGDHPIAVLLQQMVEPTIAGVLFGVDPVTGRSDRLVVTAVEGQPEQLVSGEVAGSRHVLALDGTPVDLDTEEGPAIAPDRLQELADLAHHVADLFHGPQDVEWAVVDGDLVLLQSRPVTTEIRGVPQGRIYGPGPVAETFPEPLAPLEADLWIPPLDDAVRRALRLAAAVPADELEDGDLVILADGRAAIDLERTGEIESRRDRPAWHAVSDRIRRLRTAWRVGRLRTALPSLAQRLLDIVDDDLESLPPLGELSDRQVVALLGRGRMALRSLHAHEVLMGLLVEKTENRLTGASVAMRVLAEARTDGRADAHIIAHSPVVLALVPPSIGPSTPLPAASDTPDLPIGHGEEQPEEQPDHSGVLREALRLRVRWVHELTGRAAWLLGESLERTGHLPDAEDVRLLTYDDLVAVVTRRAEIVPDVLAHRRAQEPPSGSLPARFRLSDRGRPVAERAEGQSGGGTGAGGGRERGPVTHDTDDPPKGSVLVVGTLTPGLGPLLSRLSGVVAETGSVLAHLAILAREHGVPTVVGHTGALDELPEGVEVVVDGDSGQIEIIDDDTTHAGNDGNEEEQR